MAYTGTSIVLPGFLETSQTEGLIATTTNNSADPGSVGEFMYSAVEGTSPVDLTSGADTDITSISLTAGDWQVWGNVSFLVNNATNVVNMFGWISNTSATLPNSAFVTKKQNPSGGFATGVNGVAWGSCVPTRRFSLTTPTTIYLSVRGSFSVNFLRGFGTITARRLR